MFSISQSSSYTWPVTVEFPISGGKTEKQTFDVEFKRLTQSKIKELRDAAYQGKLTDDETCRQIVVGWRGVSDNGQELPFSPENLDALLEIALVPASIVRSFFDSMEGAKRKN